MPEDKKTVSKDGAGENQNQTEAEVKLAASEVANAELQSKLDVANDDVSRYQGEADRAKSKLDTEEQLNVREEGLVEREHNANLADVKKDYPDVFESYSDAFDTLKGSESEAYIIQAKYLQEGIDKHKNINTDPNEITDEDKKKKEEEINKTKDGAPLLPESGQENGDPHTFTREELNSHVGDQKWYAANEEAINDQLAKGLII